MNDALVTWAEVEGKKKNEATEKTPKISAEQTTRPASVDFDILTNESTAVVRVKYPRLHQENAINNIDYQDPDTLDVHDIRHAGMEQQILPPAGGVFVPASQAVLAWRQRVLPSYPGMIQMKLLPNMDGLTPGPEGFHDFHPRIRDIKAAESPSVDDEPLSRNGDAIAMGPRPQQTSWPGNLSRSGTFGHIGEFRSGIQMAKVKKMSLDTDTAYLRPFHQQALTSTGLVQSANVGEQLSFHQQTSNRSYQPPRLSMGDIPESPGFILTLTLAKEAPIQTRWYSQVSKEAETVSEAVVQPNPAMTGGTLVADNQLVWRSPVDSSGKIVQPISLNILTVPADVVFESLPRRSSPGSGLNASIPEFTPRQASPRGFGMGAASPRFSPQFSLPLAAETYPQLIHRSTHHLRLRTEPNTPVVDQSPPSNNTSQAAIGGANIVDQIPARSRLPLAVPAWQNTPNHTLRQAPREPRAFREGNINVRRFTIAAPRAQNPRSEIRVLQQALPPPVTPVSHTQSRTWKNPKVSEYDEWARVEAGLLRFGFIKRIPGKKDGGSPFVPHTFEEWLEFRVGRAKDLHDEAAEKLRLRTSSGYVPLGHKRGKAVKIALAMGRKVFNDGLSTVLAQPTTWSLWNRPSETRPQGSALWPCHEEMKEEGDERYTSGFRRFPALPRVVTNETVVWKQRPLLHALPFDATWTVPNKDSAAETILRLPTDTQEEEMEALVGHSLMAAIDMDFLE